MKTPGVTVGLLLLFAVCLCAAMLFKIADHQSLVQSKCLQPSQPKEPSSSVSPAHGPNDLRPGRCCFKFFPGRIPEAHILSIAKTHQSCTKRGFVINTPQGDYCVNLNQQWAIRAFLKTPKAQKGQGAPSTLTPA